MYLSLFHVQRKIFIQKWFLCYKVVTGSVYQHWFGLPTPCLINTAAASFAWENVYYYDFTFRQLMFRATKSVMGKDIQPTMEYCDV